MKKRTFGTHLVVGAAGVLIGFSAEAQPLDSKPASKPSVVWSGSASGAMFRSLAKNNSGLEVRSGEKAASDEILIRAGSTPGFVEVLNKSDRWVAASIPYHDAGRERVNTDAFIKQLLFSWHCNLVKTTLSFSESTQKAAVYFNSKNVGVIQDDGRFFYESEGICRDSDVQVTASLAGCQDFKDTFRAKDNPHNYTGKAALTCRVRQ